MILPVHDRLRAHLTRLLATHYSLDQSALPALVLEYPPNRDLGDLGTPVAFELARRLRKAPRAIAQEIAAAFGALEGIRQVAAAPNGHLNFFLERQAFLLDRLSPAGPAPRPVAGKAIVEHTAINPNKAAHIGHLRNAALGDTLVRVLRFRGVAVEVQNYIDDTGVQVADVVVGFRVLEGKTLADVRTIADTTRFDFHCWDLYARVTEWYDGDKGRLEIRTATLHDIEHGGNENAEIAAFVADRIVRCHLVTMARMNVDYDLLTWEGDILRLKFWAQAFEVLKAKNAVHLRSEGRLAGCWVMPIQEDLASTPNSRLEPEPTPPPPRAEVQARFGVASPKPDAHDGMRQAAAGNPQGDEDPEEREKVIVRSNGVVTYVGKDIAYQFWKLGLLGRDFKYRVFTARPHGPLWATTSSDGVAGHPPFGGASYVYNVIDVRQSYLQKLLKQALIAVGHPEGADRSHHFSYEMVALSHATARELGFAPPPDSEDAKRPFVEVSGRKGLGVKADDLLDTVVRKAGGEVAKRNPELSAEDVERTARMIGIAAVRYFLIKFSRGKVIAFDLDEALSFEGESGPYVQYAVVRANNIFQKLQQRDGLDETALLGALRDVPAGELTGENGGHELWALVLEASRLDEIVEQVIRSLEFSVLAKYAFSLAQAFNAFYHRSPILNEERDDVRRWRAAAVIYLRMQLTRALDLMGVAVPGRM
ncbi:MAG TPA: arginine--tRNA ligase [Vicinamibacterales bacterium]|nr:arginine--tRNA ligase [Vicinamibacterales bacterium]